MLKHKFFAKPQITDGIKFASKKEQKRYLELKLLEASGELCFFLRQTPFHLPGNIKYICDFMNFWADGTVTIDEVKGFKTAAYITKKKIVEAIYPVTINEI